MLEQLLESFEREAKIGNVETQKEILHEIKRKYTNSCINIKDIIKLSRTISKFSVSKLNPNRIVELADMYNLKERAEEARREKEKELSQYGNYRRKYFIHNALGPIVTEFFEWTGKCELAIEDLTLIKDNRAIAQLDSTAYNGCLIITENQTNTLEGIKEDLAKKAALIRKEDRNIKVVGFGFTPGSSLTHINSWPGNSLKPRYFPLMRSPNRYKHQRFY